MNFEPDTKVDLMRYGKWEGPFIVTSRTGRTPEHLVLRNPENGVLFEEHVDELSIGYQIRPHTEPERPRACLRCMNTTVNGTAVSRTDNKTKLCTQCETAEALEDMSGRLMPQEDWVYAKMSKAYGIEPVGLTLNKENKQ